MRYRALPLSLLLACGARPEPLPATSAGTLELYPRASEVWAFELTLHGRLGREGGPAGALVQCELLDAAGSNGASALAKVAAHVEGSAFSATLPVPPEQELRVRAQCRDRSGRVHHSEPVRVSSRMSSAPTARATASIRGRELALSALESTPNGGTRAPLETYAWFRADPRDGALTPLGEGRELALRLPDQPGEHVFAVRVRDRGGREALAKTAIVVTGEAARRMEEGGAPWIDRAVVYGVIPPLYGRPPLAQVEAALDPLRELGVDALWLSPIFQTPPDDFGYAVTDYFSVREDYGDQAALTALIQAAHARGMRVLLDLVINHSSAQHRYFREAEALGKRSHYHAFYDRDESGAPTHYFDWTHLPNFDFGNREVAEWALSFSRHWVDVGADGYRVDAAWGVRQRSPEFYPLWSVTLRSLRPDVFLLAEASARDPYYLKSGFDAAYDWTSELGHHAWEHVFTKEPGIARRLAAQLEETARTAPRPERTFRFLNNNDTGARFITRHGEPLTRVATAALLTLPGIPCLYTLDEIGAAFEPYEEAVPERSERPALRALHQQLIALRKRTPALHGAGYRALRVGEDRELFAFLRTGARAGEVAVVALNFGAAPIAEALSLPPDAVRAFGGRARELQSDARVPVAGGRLRLALGGFGVQIFVPDAR